MIGAAGESVLSARAARQPHPFICAGGDCGACALGGAIGMTVEQIYQEFDTKGITHSGEMERCLRCAVSNGRADRVIEDAAEWPQSYPFRQFGRPSVLEALPWFNHVRMAIDAGYYGLAEVNYDGSAVIGEYETNHWVLICGARTEGAVRGKVITGEILVSCSAGRLNGWHEVRDFLKTRGGYSVLFARPANR